MIDLAILASANGTNAQAIIDATKSGKLKANVRVVLTNKPEAGFIEKAKKAGIPVEIIPSRGYKNRREEYDTLVVEALRKYNVDTIALAGWMRILSSVFIDAYGGRIINLHPAILPSFKGHKGIEAYAYGVKVTGCSVHLVVPELDAGPLIIQAAVPVKGSLEELEEQIHRMEHRILPQALQWFSEGRISLNGNVVKLKEPETECKKIDYIEGCLVWPPIEEKI